MRMYDRDTGDHIRDLTHSEAVMYLETIGNDPYGYVLREIFDPGTLGVVYAL